MVCSLINSTSKNLTGLESFKQGFTSSGVDPQTIGKTLSKKKSSPCVLTSPTPLSCIVTSSLTTPWAT